MARPRTPIGAFGEISFTTMPNGQVQARTRFRDDDGKVRRVAATGPSRAAAERRLKTSLTHRTTRSSFAELSPDSSFTHLVEMWLEDLDLEDKVAESTRALYERNMRQLVLPPVLPPPGDTVRTAPPRAFTWLLDSVRTGRALNLVPGQKADAESASAS